MNKEYLSILINCMSLKEYGVDVSFSLITYSYITNTGSISVSIYENGYAKDIQPDRKFFIFGKEGIRELQEYIGNLIFQKACR